MPVQQQAYYIDCGVYSIAYTYHAALGDELATLQCDSKKMRKHLIDCFTAEKLSPFSSETRPATNTMCRNGYSHSPLLHLFTTGVL